MCYLGLIRLCVNIYVGLSKYILLVVSKWHGLVFLDTVILVLSAI